MGSGVASWVITLFLLGHCTAEGGPGEALTYEIINFNFQTMQVTWDLDPHAGPNLTFLYHFQGKNSSQCPHYILQEGRTCGCLLPATEDKIISVSILNGTQCLLSKSFWISDYLKPNVPRDLSFWWLQEAVVVTCANLPYKGLRYEVHFKSPFDEVWQSQEKETCNMTIPGLDAEKCYSFRVRVRPMESSYKFTAYHSDWSEVTHLRRGEPQDSCQEERTFSKSVLIYGLAAFLSLSLLLLCVWKLHRVKKLLIASVPDPKFSFPGLFESHHGNFQEWIRETQNLTQLNKLEDGEPESVLEEALVVQLPTAEAKTPVTTVTGPPRLQTVEKEASGVSSQLSSGPPQGKDVLSLGGFRFMMSDNSYVTL